MADDKQRPDAGPPGEIPGEERAGAEQPTETSAESGERPAADVATEEATAHPALDAEADAPVHAANGGDDTEKDAALAPEIAPKQEPTARESQGLPAAPARRRTPWFALFLAGLIGGAVVAGAAAYAWLVYTEDDGVMSVLWARLGAVELAVQDLSSHELQSAAGLASTDQLAERVAKLEAAAASAAAARPAVTATTDSADSALVERLTGLEVVAKSLAEVVARLERRSDETVAAIQAMRTDAAAGIAPGQQAAVEKAEFEALSQRVAALQQGAASLQQSIERTSATLQQSVAHGAETAAADRAVRLAVVASGLRSAVQRGAPYTGELDAARTLAPDPQALAPLQPFAASGVPSAQALGREFLALAPKLAQTAKSSSGGDYVERLLSHAERLVRIRPVNEAAGGDDGSGIVARAETRAEHADIPGVLAELGKLPESARAPAAEWMKKAEAREAAVAAAQRIENAALAALAKP